MATLILYTVVLFSQSPEGGGRIAMSKDRLFPPEAALVRAVLRPDGRYQVRNVYVGRQAFKGYLVTGNFTRLYTAAVIDQIVMLGKKPSFGSKNTRPEAVFWAGSRAGTDDLRLVAGAGPSAVDYDPAFDRNTRECIALQKVYEATDEQRMAVVDRLIRGRDVAVALRVLRQVVQSPANPPAKLESLCWSPIRRSVKDPKLDQYLRGLSRDHSISIPVLLETEYAVRDSKGWKSSKDARELLRYWFAGDWVNGGGKSGLGSSHQSTEDEVVQWLSNATLDRAYPLDQLVASAVAGLANPRRTQSFKDNIIAQFSNRAIANWSWAERQQVFSMLVSGLQGKDREPLAAARMLHTLSPLDDTQAAEVGRSLDAIEDQRIAKELRAWAIDGRPPESGKKR